MINIRSPREIELMAKAGSIVYQTHQYLMKYLKPGITTKELNDLGEKFILSKNATPSFKGFGGYPAAICISINEEVVHGIPDDYKLKTGDIVSLDIGACFQGYHGDSGWTYAIGEISSDKQYLLEHTKNALYKGISQVKPGNYIQDISRAIENYAKEYNLGVIRELVGHGIGNNVHEAPDVPNYDNKHKGPMLKEGMVIAIEPMLTLGSRAIVIEDDDWTIATKDRSPSAHYEHTVAVTRDGFRILTGE